MTIWDWVLMQNRGVLPKEVHQAFPDRSAKQISDSLNHYVSRQKMKRIPIPAAGRRYRYVAIDWIAGQPEQVWGMSEVRPELLPLARIK